MYWIQNVISLMCNIWTSLTLSTSKFEHLQLLLTPTQCCNHEQIKSSYIEHLTPKVMHAYKIKSHPSRMQHIWLRNSRLWRCYVTMHILTVRFPNFTSTLYITWKNSIFFLIDGNWQLLGNLSSERNPVKHFLLSANHTHCYKIMTYLCFSANLLYEGDIPKA